MNANPILKRANIMQQLGPTLEEAIMQFMREKCEVDPAGEVYASDLYYLLRCKAQTVGIYYMLAFPTQTRMTQTIKKLYPLMKTKLSSRCTVFLGIRLKSVTYASLNSEPVVSSPIADLDPLNFEQIVAVNPVNWQSEIAIRILDIWKTTYKPVIEC